MTLINVSRICKTIYYNKTSKNQINLLRIPPRDNITKTKTRINIRVNNPISLHHKTTHNKIIHNNKITHNQTIYNKINNIRTIPMKTNTKMRNIRSRLLINQIRILCRSINNPSYKLE